MQREAIWRTLIVDNDPASRAHLRKLLASHSAVEVIGEAGSIEGATDLSTSLTPDLLILDPQLPDGLGFDLLPHLQKLPGIIFLSSQEEFAVQAIEVGAIDYLLKPLTADRLTLALSRLRGRIPDAIANPQPLYMVDLMIVPVHRSYRVVPTNQIVCLKADACYSILHLVDGRELYVYRALGEWEHHLPQEGFLRLDRSLIVAPAHIKDLEITNRESASMALVGLEDPLKIGRTAISRLRDYLGAADLASLPKRIST